MWIGLYLTLAVATCGLARAELSEAELNEAVIGTSIDMFRAVTSGEPKNRVVSPVSAGILLALLNHGAEDSSGSSQQLQTALRLNQEQIKEGYSKLATSLKEDIPPGLELQWATRMFVSESISVQNSYNDSLAEYYKAGVRNVPFGSQEASRAINSWAYKATNGKITSIVDSISPPTTAVLLANAIYFKSPWMNQFRVIDTGKESFIVEANRNVTVNLMNRWSNYKIGSNQQLGVKWIQIPFKGGKYNLVVVLPDKTFGLADALKEMTSSDLKQMLNEGQSTSVNLYLPRFRFSSSIKLSPVFEKLGITDVFDQEKAKLSGISSDSDLKVTDCYQKAVLDIDETGGSSSISSGDEIGIVSGAENTLPSAQEFRVDRPFLAVIAQKRGIPLFMSTVVDPTSG